MKSYLILTQKVSNNGIVILDIMRVILDVQPDEFELIGALVRKGAYRNIQQFVTAALANQLHLESFAEDAPAASGVGPDILKPRTIEGLDPPVSSTVTLKATPPKDAPLWGQYYRFLPLKVVLRIVATSTAEAPVEIEGIGANVSSTARAFARKLESVASSLEISPFPGFPATTGTQVKMAKSESRFLAQYLGSVGKDGRPRGFPFDLGFLALEGKSPTKIALSPAGLEFVMLPNPLIDDGKSQPLPLSADESKVVLQHIAAHLPEESGQIRELVSLLQSGPKSPASLDKHFSNYYRKRFGLWSDAKCTTMRAGLSSRCIETGLVINSKEGYALGPRYSELVGIVGGLP